MQCPICDYEFNEKGRCENCGFRAATDYLRQRTLTPISREDRVERGISEKYIFLKKFGDALNNEQSARLKAADNLINSLKAKVDELTKQLETLQAAGKEPEKKQLQLNVGDTMKFGFYAGEPIEWTVLTKENDKALLLSKYAIDCKKYHSNYNLTAWEECSLRKWLNNSFANNAFQSRDLKRIVLSNNDGIADRVFLLSAAEAKKYLPSNEMRQCAPTAFTIAQGARVTKNIETASGEGTCLWWLRSPGNHREFAAGVYFDGSIYYRGWAVDYNIVCVRPAMWISLEG